MIGIVGGVGPLAGIDLHLKIVHNTVASADQAHLPVLLATFAKEIGDRTEYVVSLQQNKVPKRNPGKEIGMVMEKLIKAGATILGVPCNTAHCPPVWNETVKYINQKTLTNKTIVNMIVETMAVLKEKGISTMGIMGTLGTYAAKTYEIAGERHNIKVLRPSEKDRASLHEAIYHPQWGVKGNSAISQKATDVMCQIAETLTRNGAEAVVMACTEIPLVLNKANINVATIDPTEILARALIREEDAAKLKPV